MVLIGMPGIEKRLARYPQFYWRIGFVHEYRPLGTPEIEALLAARWTPPGVSLPPDALTEDIIGRIAAMTQGNFRLLNRLLTQLERVLDVNDTSKISVAIHLRSSKPFLTDRSITIQPPQLESFTMDSLIPSDELLYIRYRRKETNTGRGGDARILEVSPTTSEALREVKLGDFTMWDVFCVHKGVFRVAKMKSHYEFQFVPETIVPTHF